MRRPLGALSFAVILTGALPGCALYNTYEKCGLHGCPGDAKITADIVSQFHQHSDLEPNAIAVQTLDRVVYLHGLVSSGLEIDTAESIARSAPGVARVVSSIAVSNPVW
jgi:osmotically-inducible protein OsmY